MRNHYLVHSYYLTADFAFLLYLAMAISWNGSVPTEEQWVSLEGHPLEVLDSIKGMHSTISSNALMELLHRLGQPQGVTANATKQKMALTVSSALVDYEGWLTADVSNVWLASSNKDLADLSLLAFGLELSVVPPICLFFPAGAYTFQKRWLSLSQMESPGMLLLMLLSPQGILQRCWLLCGRASPNEHILAQL